jgi:hypothetical protein
LFPDYSERVDNDAMSHIREFFMRARGAFKAVGKGFLMVVGFFLIIFAKAPSHMHLSQVLGDGTAHADVPLDSGYSGASASGDSGGGSGSGGSASGAGCGGGACGGADGDGGGG